MSGKKSDFQKAIETLRNPAPGVTLVSHGWKKREPTHAELMDLVRELDHALRDRVRGCACDCGGNDGELLARSRKVING